VLFTDIKTTKIQVKFWESYKLSAASYKPEGFTCSLELAAKS
jgi:hypothetical protein